MALPRLKRPPEWGVEPVPEAQRTLGFLDLFVLWSSLGVGLLVLAAGAFMIYAFGLSLAESLAVAAVGSVAGSLLLAAAGLPGSRAGVPTMVSLRPIVGRLGSFAPSAFNAFQLLAWAAFELLVMGLAATVIVGEVWGPWTPAVFVPLFGGVVFALAVGGPLAVVRHWLEKFAIWIVYGTTAALTALVVLHLGDASFDWGARPFAQNYAGWPSLLLALDLVIVMPISWWPLVADYNRFGRSARTAFTATTLGYTAANTAYYALGAALAAFAAVAIPGADYPDFLAAIALLGLGGLPLLVILVDETDNAFANIYSTAVSAQNVAPRVRQGLLVASATAAAGVGAVALVAAGEGLGGSFEVFLLFIGGVFIPLLGVVVADALLVRRAGYRAPEFEGAAPPYRGGALVSWAAGVAVYYAVYQGVIPGGDLVGSTLPSFAAAVALHVLLSQRSRAKHGAAP